MPPTPAAPERGEIFERPAQNGAAHVILAEPTIRSCRLAFGRHATRSTPGGVSRAPDMMTVDVLRCGH